MLVSSSRVMTNRELEAFIITFSFLVIKHVVERRIWDIKIYKTTKAKLLFTNQNPNDTFLIVRK